MTWETGWEWDGVGVGVVCTPSNFRNRKFDASYARLHPEFTSLLGDCPLQNLPAKNKMRIAENSSRSKDCAFVTSLQFCFCHFLKF